MKATDCQKLDHYLNSKIEPFWANVVYCQIRNFTCANKVFYYDFREPKSRKSTKYGYITSLSFNCNAMIETPDGFVYYFGKIEYNRANGKHVVEFTKEKEVHSA